MTQETLIKEEKTKDKLNEEEYLFLKHSLEQSNKIEIDGDEEEQDSYFKNVVNQLMDYKKPSTKTEYVNVNENFCGAKLQFLAEFGNIPYLDKFIEIFEVKRVSLERKGRKELIMALVEREKEMQRERDEKIKNMLVG